MRRKLIKQGQSALTVTLPMKWVKLMNLMDKTEIDCEEKGNLLIFSADKDPEVMKKEIDITQLNERTIRWFISGLQKGGYDEIDIFYNGEDQLNLVSELLKDLMLGFAIIEQTEKRVKVKAITKDVPDEFFTILRRAFLVGLNLAETCLEKVKSGKLINLKNLASLEQTNNQLTNYCERIINKGILPVQENPYFLYVIAWNLEKVVDDYKYIAQDLNDKKVNLSKEVIKLFEKVNRHFRSYYELFYKFDAIQLSELSINRRKIQNDIKNQLEITKGNDSLVLSYLYTILMKCEDFSSSMFMLRHK